SLGGSGERICENQLTTKPRSSPIRFPGQRYRRDDLRSYFSLVLLYPSSVDLGRTSASGGARAPACLRHRASPRSIVRRRTESPEVHIQEDPWRSKRQGS